MDQEKYGHGKDDMMLDDITKDITNLTDSQKINIKILQAITSINTALNDLQHDVKIHDKLLVTGNGVPSIQERLRYVEEYIDGIKYWIRLVGGAILLQTITFGIAVVWVVIKAIPILERLSQNP